MMIIKKEKTLYHLYALESDFSQDLVSYCLYLKQTLGWKEFQWDIESKKWRFKDPAIIIMIKNKFLDLEMDLEVKNDVKLYEQSVVGEQERDKNAKRIKESTVSGLKIKGIKGELYEYQKLGIEFLLNSGGRALLADAPGCIAGDQKIIVNRGGNARTYNIRDLYLKTKIGIETYKDKNCEIGSFRGFDPRVQSRTRSLSEDNVFRLNNIKEVISSGNKKTVTITAKTDKKNYSVRLTYDHEIATPSGWTQAGLLSIGDLILTNGKLPKEKYCEICKKVTQHSTYLYASFPGECKSCIYRSKRNNTRKCRSETVGEYLDKSGYVMVTGCFFHKAVLLKKGRYKPEIRKHILVYEAKLNNVTYDKWLEMVRTNTYTEKSIFIDSKVWAVHHLNGIVNDNRIDNLQMLTHKEHAELEGKEYKFTNISEMFLPEKAIIIKIEDSGVIDTYDLVMDDPNRNFIVNGVVVHNCGKTSQTLGYITHSGHKRTLIVCPASVKFSWSSEIDKWTSLKSFVVGPKTDLETIPFDVNCLIVNYDILKKFYNEFMKYNFDCLVCDESHLIKSPTAQRSKVIKMLSRNIPNVIMLTGTPVLSRPVEMYNMLNIIDPKVWNNYYGYCTKYCDGKQGYFGFEAKGATNLPELKEKISKYFLRRTKEEVLKELPPKNFIDVPIDLPTEERKQYDLVESNLVAYLKKYKKDKSDKEIAKSLAAEKLVKLNLLREISAMGKLSTARELIETMIEAGEKTLVFSSFNGPLVELYEEYQDNAVMIIGSTKIEERGEIVKKFQEDPNVKIFFGGLRSANTGITLTAASNVIFLDFDFVPATMEQALNRAHRPSAVYECLNIYQIISKDSVDGFMKKLLKRKQEIVDQLMVDGETGETENMIDDYLKELEMKYKKS